MCEADAVKIVICLQVIDELDEKKYDSRLGDRAVSALKQIETLTESGDPVREGVSIEIYQPGTLTGSGDKLIIRQIVGYVEETGDQNVAVYSDDTGMRLRCSPHGIEVIKPDQSTRKPLIQSEQTKRIRELEEENAKLKAQYPKIEIFVSHFNQELKTEIPFKAKLSKPDNDFDVKNELERRREQLELKFSDEEISFILGGKERFPLRGRVDINQVISKYMTELEIYLQDYENFLKDVHDAINQNARKFVFMMNIRNSGSAPAETIDLTIKLPPIFSFISGIGTTKGKSFCITEPTPPKFHPQNNRSITPDLAGITVPDDHMKEPFVYHGRGVQRWPVRLIDGGAEGYSMTTRIEQLVHTESFEFGPFAAIFKTWDEASTFDAEVTGTVVNPPLTIKDSIKFVIKVDS